MVWRYTNISMREYGHNFDIIDKDDEIKLGGLIESRGGYLGTFDKVNGFFL
jgi:hypothetical protein